MELDLYMEEQQFRCEMDEAIALFKESMNKFDIACQEIALAQMQNSVLTESAGFLYEDAAEAANAANKTVIGKIISTIGNFIKTIIDKIRNFFKNNKTEEEVNEIKDVVNEDPSLGQEKVEIFDLNTLTERQKKYFNRVKGIIAKQQAGQPLNKSELKKLNDWMNDEYGKINAKKIVVPISAAIAAVGGAMAYCKASDTTLNELGGIIKNNVSKVAGNVKYSIQDKVEDAKYNAGVNKQERKNQRANNKDEDIRYNAGATMNECKELLAEANKQYAKNTQWITDTIQNLEDTINAAEEKKGKPKRLFAKRRNEKLQDKIDAAQGELEEYQKKKKTADQDHANKTRPLTDKLRRATDEYHGAVSRILARNDQTPDPDAKKAHDEKKNMIQNKREENKRKADENLEQIRKGREERIAAKKNKNQGG